MFTNHYIKGFDMKKRVMIYVNESDWIDIRFSSLKMGLSAGDYLVGLHKSSGTVISPEIETVEVKVEPTDDNMPIPEVKPSYPEAVRKHVIEEARQKINNKLGRQDWRDSITPMHKKGRK
jgi:hypothetical protein